MESEQAVGLEAEGHGVTTLPHSLPHTSSYYPFGTIGAGGLSWPGEENW